MNEAINAKTMQMNEAINAKTMRKFRELDFFLHFFASERIGKKCEIFANFSFSLETRVPQFQPVFRIRIILMRIRIRGSASVMMDPDPDSDTDPDPR